MTKSLECSNFALLINQQEGSQIFAIFFLKKLTKDLQGQKFAFLFINQRHLR
jgi:hypothetical protein